MEINSVCTLSRNIRLPTTNFFIDSVMKDVLRDMPKIDFSDKTTIDINLKNKPISKKTCIVLDLDNTLIHYIHKTQHQFIAPKNSGLKFFIYDKDSLVFLRPFLYEFLSGLLEIADVGIWTFGTYQYVTKILKHLNIDIKLFKFVYARDYPPNSSIHVTQPFKSLRYIKQKYPGYDSYIIIDDNHQNCYNNPSENIWVRHFSVFKNNMSQDTTLQQLYTLFKKNN